MLKTCNLHACKCWKLWEQNANLEMLKSCIFRISMSWKKTKIWKMRILKSWWSSEILQYSHLKALKHMKNGKMQILKSWKLEAWKIVKTCKIVKMQILKSWNVAIFTLEISENYEKKTNLEVLKSCNLHTVKTKIWKMRT